MNIIITGASGGIGLALAKAYAKPGACLGLIARNPSKLSEVTQFCRQQEAAVVPGILDVTDTEALKSWLLAFDQQHPVDLVIANAGVTSIMPADGENERWEDIQQVLNVNIHGVFNTVYPLLEPMRQRRNGHIAIISSLAAYRGLPITPAYCASKAAIKSYGEALHGWLRQDGVQVSVVCPGFVKSELSDQFPKPKFFMLTAEQAARAIQRGLAGKQALIDFPWPLAVGMRLLALMPNSVAEAMLKTFGYGASRKGRLKPRP